MKLRLVKWRIAFPALLVAATLWGGGVATATTAHSDTPACLPTDESRSHAELFATNNTGVITDPDDPRLQDPLQLFEIQADETIAQSGQSATGSTLVDGVFWSDELQQSTYERSREFHLCDLDEPQLHTAAEALRTQFNQKSVLTFEYLPQHAPGADAVVIEVPKITVADFHDALMADSTARDRLQGGSVTADQTLILVAAGQDLGIAHRLVNEAAGRWDAATIRYGKREFVD